MWKVKAGLGKTGLSIKFSVCLRIKLMQKDQVLMQSGQRCRNSQNASIRPQTQKRNKKTKQVSIMTTEEKILKLINAFNMEMQSVVTYPRGTGVEIGKKQTSNRFTKIQLQKTECQNNYGKNRESSANRQKSFLHFGQKRIEFG